MADISISAVVETVSVAETKIVAARDKAVSYVGSASAQANTVNPPAHVNGDLVVVFAHRDGSTTNPTVASGYTTITNTTDGTSNSISVGCRVSDGTLANTGTWTNATSIAAIISDSLDARTKLFAGPPTRSVVCLLSSSDIT